MSGLSLASPGIKQKAGHLIFIDLNQKVIRFIQTATGASVKPFDTSFRGRSRTAPH
jgi:hypothetical protein